MAKLLKFCYTTKDLSFATIKIISIDSFLCGAVLGSVAEAGLIFTENGLHRNVSILVDRDDVDSVTWSDTIDNAISIVRKNTGLNLNFNKNLLEMEDMP